MKPSSVARIPTTLQEFFQGYLMFLRPYHGLTPKQITVAAAFLKARYELSKVITDEKILDEVVANKNTKKKIREECDIPVAHFQVLIGDLRKHKFFVDGKINPRYIPNLDPVDPKSFSLMLLFVFNEPSTARTV